MRTIFSIIALFSLCALQAQAPEASYGKEPARGKVLSYPTEELATAAGEEDNRYLSRIGSWEKEQNGFSTPFTVPFAWANRQVILHIASVSDDYEVVVNEKKVAYNANGNLPAEFNITRYVNEGRNTLQIVTPVSGKLARIESWKTAAQPTIGEAWLMSQPTLRIRDVLVKTWQSDSTVVAEIGVIARSSALNPRSSRIHYRLLDPSGRQTAAGHKDMTLDMRREDTLRVLVSIPTNLLWSAELPTQYTLRLQTQHEGRYAEYLEFRLGFRTFENNKGKISINGQPVTLHAREVSPQITEDEIARLREQGYNTLKLLPGIVPQKLYDICDQMGVYVIAQAPIDSRSSGLSRKVGGNPTNDPAWLAPYLERTAESYHTAKRHPSVVGFSLAKESANGINLYESYLKLKKIHEQRPFIYPDAGGEWNTDRLEYDLSPGSSY